MKQAKIYQDKLYIIAELGINHNGDLNIAKKLIKNAKFSGFDAVKFQTFKAKNEITRNWPTVVGEFYNPDHDQIKNFEPIEGKLVV